MRREVSRISWDNLPGGIPPQILGLVNSIDCSSTIRRGVAGHSKSLHQRPLPTPIGNYLGYTDTAFNPDGESRSAVAIDTTGEAWNPNRLNKVHVPQVKRLNTFTCFTDIKTGFSPTSLSVRNKARLLVIEPLCFTLV